MNESAGPSDEHQQRAAAMGTVGAGLGAHPTPQARRQAWDELQADLALPAGVTVDRRDASGVEVDLVRPDGAGAVAVLYFHGGGYSAGSLVTHRQFAARLSVAGGASVMNVGYRLAPEHPFPAALDDARATYQHLLDTGTAPGHIVIAGDSAGGGLALCLLLDLKAREMPLPAAGMVLAPLVDVRLSEGSSPTMLDLYLAGHDPGDPLVSPLAGDLSGLPPLFLQVSENEPLYPSCLELVDAARRAGVEVEVDAWPGLMHTWEVFAPDAAETHEAIRRLGAFVRRSVGV
jgi:monoterpene epsilon-lactone hydrolase